MMRVTLGRHLRGDAMRINRRELLAVGLGLPLSSAVALARQAPTGARVPTRTAKTTRLFKSPGLYPNALAVMTDPPGGLWIGQQKITTAAAAKTYTLPIDVDPNEAAWLVDWNGKLIKTVTTNSRNTSGIAYGDGFVWMGANAEPFGIFQVDLNARQVSHRQIPLSI